MNSPHVTPDRFGAALDTLRERVPLVQCLTNIVVAQWTANVLLAAGAAPAMIDNPREARGFAAVADGVLVNLGTPYAETVEAMAEAVAGAAEAGTAWVLDPVGAGGLAWRTEEARRLLDAHAPTVLRGNTSEVEGMAGGAGGRGVDASGAAADINRIAHDLAVGHGMVVAASGKVDHLTDGERVVRIANGHVLLTRVTGVGCALGALMAAYAGVVDDPLVASGAATAHLTVAAEQAVQRGQGPGSFAVVLLDELAALTPEALVELAVLE